MSSSLCFGGCFFPEIVVAFVVICCCFSGDCILVLVIAGGAFERATEAVVVAVLSVFGCTPSSEGGAAASPIFFV